MKKWFNQKDTADLRENPDIELEASVCTGERLIGIRNRKTGALEQAELVRSDRDIARYRQAHRLLAPEEDCKG